MSIRIEDLAKTDFSQVTAPRAKRISPASPGEMLRDEFLKPMGLTNYRLAKEIDVPAQRIGEIVAGRRGITADTDLRLCRFFGLSDGLAAAAGRLRHEDYAQRTCQDAREDQALGGRAAGSSHMRVACLPVTPSRRCEKYRSLSPKVQWSPP